MERLLVHLGIFSEGEIEARHTAGGGHPAPWLIAARVLRGGPLLDWPHLWDVLRWYAHNRGYDGNRAWSTTLSDQDEEEDNTEKVQKAHELLKRYNVRSMAEVYCHLVGLDPLGDVTSTHSIPPERRPRGQGAAFPREVVEAEVRAILERHCGQLPRLDDAFIRALLEDWTAVPCPAIRLPGRYGQFLSSGRRTPGGLLFGQLVPRFENRIIGSCPIAYQRIYQEELAQGGDEKKAHEEAEKRSKLPGKRTPEFLKYRWVMQLTNVVVQSGKSWRYLSKEERLAVHVRMETLGSMTKSEFKKSVEEVVGKGVPTNLEQLLAHPEAEKALVYDPVRAEIRKKWGQLFDLLPQPAQKRAVGRLRRGHPVTLAELLERYPSPEVESAVVALIESGKTRKRKGQAAPTRESFLATRVQANFPNGRAPHTREVMKEVAQFVLSSDRHPMETDGPLYRSEEIRAAQRQRAIDLQTNNHLIRHRLLMLDRLHRQLLETYDKEGAEGVGRVTVEVNRDLKDLSGQTAKQIASEMGRQLSNFKTVSEKVERALENTGRRITAGLIRKARIAEDLGWCCPYTGQSYDVIDLCERVVDVDHVIPYADRPSDSLDSLVITFSAVNRMKGKRTAMAFINECGGQAVDGAPHLTLRTPEEYIKAIQALECFKGHNDDKRRKRRRKDALLLEKYVEKEFTPGDLTQTSHLVRLAAQLLERPYDRTALPVVTSMPGRVTAVLRNGWHLTGCMAEANPAVLDPLTSNVRTKTELRGITHLHHALDACVLGLCGFYLPRDGRTWELLVKRRLNEKEQKELKSGPLAPIASFDKEGRLILKELPRTLKQQLSQQLAKRRVVQHLPSELDGLKVEQNAWRVVEISEEGEASLLQRRRQLDGTRQTVSQTVKVSKLFGLAKGGKLHRNKAVLVIPENYGIALDPEPQIIPYFKVPVQLRQLKELNGGKPVRVMRNGMLIDVPTGRYQGCWRIFSVKNNASGLAVNLAPPDAVRFQSGNPLHKIALVKTLIQNGMIIRKGDLTGGS